jgi:hypothetical protein
MNLFAKKKNLRDLYDHDRRWHAPFCANAVQGGYAAGCKKRPSYLRTIVNVVDLIPRFDLATAFLSEGTKPSALVDNMFQR